MVSSEPRYTSNGGREEDGNFAGSNVFGRGEEGKGAVGVWGRNFCEKNVIGCLPNTIHRPQRLRRDRRDGEGATGHPAVSAPRFEGYPVRHVTLISLVYSRWCLGYPSSYPPSRRRYLLRRTSDTAPGMTG